MGRLRGIEPPNVGTTIRCVNHFATAAKILSLNKKMPWDRVELPTHGASIHCSTNWAIEAIFNFYIKKWRSRRESNPRSPAWQAGVITATPRDLTLILNVFNSNGDPYGIRTRVTAVKGRCLNHLTNGPIKKTEQEGFEPSRRFPDLHP